MPWVRNLDTYGATWVRNTPFQELRAVLTDAVINSALRACRDVIQNGPTDEHFGVCGNVYYAGCKEAFELCELLACLYGPLLHHGNLGAYFLDGLCHPCQGLWEGCNAEVRRAFLQHCVTQLELIRAAE